MKELLIISGLATWAYLLIYVSYVFFEKVDNYLIDRKRRKGQEARERFYKSIEDGVREGVCAFDTYTIVNHNDELLAKGEVKQPTEFEQLRELYHATGTKIKYSEPKCGYTYEYDSAKFRYVEDRLDDHLKGELSRIEFAEIFGSDMMHEEKKETWLQHLENLRSKYGKDFDEL